MTTTERLGKSSDRIKESRKTMLETEELGVSILQDLHSQRQSLLHAHNTVCDFTFHVICDVDSLYCVLVIMINQPLYFMTATIFVKQILP